MDAADLETSARQGDAAAFSSLVRAWDDDLRAVVWSVVRSATATDDVMVASYETAFGSIDRFDGQAPMKTWLHTICLRHAIEHSRATPPAVDGAGVTTEAFDSLDGVERLLLMLSTGLGFDLDQTATIVGMSRETVAATVGRARDRLQERRMA